MSELILIEAACKQVCRQVNKYLKQTSHILGVSS